MNFLERNRYSIKLNKAKKRWMLAKLYTWKHKLTEQEEIMFIYGKNIKDILKERKETGE
jgi:hypothetical protein